MADLLTFHLLFTSAAMALVADGSDAAVDAQILLSVTSAFAWLRVMRVLTLSATFGPLVRTPPTSGEGRGPS